MFEIIPFSVWLNKKFSGPWFVANAPRERERLGYLGAAHNFSLIILLMLLFLLFFICPFYLWITYLRCGLPCMHHTYPVLFRDYHPLLFRQPLQNVPLPSSLLDQRDLLHAMSFPMIDGLFQSDDGRALISVNCKRNFKYLEMSIILFEMWNGYFLWLF